MKKLTLIAGFTFLLGAGAIAQTATPATTPAQSPAKEQRQENQSVVKSDANAIQADKAKHRESRAAAKTAKKDVRADRKDMHKDAKVAKESGVKHPIDKAKKIE